MSKLNGIITKTWNKANYIAFVDYLFGLQDEKYRDFHSSLVLNSKYEIIGVRVPIMRSIAKKIANTNIEEFLKCVQDNYYEEVMIHGLVISHIKDEELFYKCFKEYISRIDNWGICDSFCSSIKIVRDYKEKYLKEAVKLSLCEEEFVSRVGLVILLNHFVCEDNLKIIFDTINKIESDKYYINMAQAWLICELYIKFPRDTKEFLKNNSLNKFTKNKAISKIRDSYRVSKEDKDMLGNFIKTP